jgi:hypothetical protein
MQLDLYTQIILSVLCVYQSANKSICNNDTWWKFKIKDKPVIPHHMHKHQSVLVFN